MKKVLYVILGLFVVYLILATTGKSRVIVERNITISKSPAFVKSKLMDLQFFHQSWSPWTEKDPAMTVDYNGNTGEVGHSMNWKSDVKEVGNGTLTIVATNGDSIIERLTFEGMGDSKAYHIVTGTENETNVVWGMDMQVGFFFRPMMMFWDMDEMIGPDYEKGLANLKLVLENSNDNGTANYDIKETEWPEVTYVGKKETVAFSKMEEFFGKNYQAIFTELGKNKINPESAPSAIFSTYDEANQKADVAAVARVAKGIKLKGFETFSYPASKVYHIAYYGAYDKSANAHYAMDDYMKKKGVEQSVVIEEYVTDPGTEKDTTKWLTNIYYLIK
jgi:effector-binding domain-containing protein